MEEKMSAIKRLVFGKSIVIGISGGIIWSAIFVLLHYFNMIEVDPVLPLELIFGGAGWTETVYARLLMVTCIGILSIFVAMLYFVSLKSIESWMAGALYGIIIWVIIFILIPLLFGKLDYFSEHTIHSNIAVICICLLYGIFIGYSISFDYKNLKIEHLK